MYNHSEKSPKTVYFSTIRSNVGGQEIVKEFAQLSVGEAFRLSFDTFLNENLLRIQAITPSDKVRIPMHEFTADFFLEGKTALTLDQMIENVKSVFSWDGEICEEKEILMMIKTRRNLYGKETLVQRHGILSDLAPVLQGRQRRRHGRPVGRLRKAGLHQELRLRRHLVLPHLPLPRC